MNKKAMPPSDVFLTYGVHDEDVAKAIKIKMTDAGLHVFAISDAEWYKKPSKTDEFEEVVRKALSDSSALVAILSPTRIDSPALATAYGAARMADKDIYVLSQDKAQVVPTYLRHYSTYAVHDLPKIMPKLVQSKQGGVLTKHHRAELSL